MAPPAPNLPRIRFTVSMPRPHTHMFDVRLEIDGWTAPTMDLVMPSWTPGSYMVRDYARHVTTFDARGLAWEKTDKSTWRVETGGRKNIDIRYSLYAWELNVRTCHLDDTHGHFSGAGMFMYVDGHTDRPIDVRIHAPAGWKIATGLQRTRRNTFRAADYDTLVDSPVEIGKFQERMFRVRGKRHSIVVHGGGNYDLHAMTRDIRKIVSAQSGFFGEAPYPHYTFILHTTPTIGGGLEHMNSTSLMFREFDFEPRDSYEGFLRLVSHEFFHLWNVKRIRPADLIPFDYRRENYTTLLWVCEGITSYYDTLFVCRTGLITPKKYLDLKAEQVRQFLAKPGRKVQSLAEASFDAWIKHYQPNENSINATMSYYEKGRLIGLLLDLTIRAHAKGRRSLDDVMRALNTRFARLQRGYTADDFIGLCSEMAGRDMKPFFKHTVTGTKDPDWNAALRTAGLRLTSAPMEKESRTDKPFLGIQTVRSGDRLQVAYVLDGSPAHEYGLNAQDELLALDGRKISAESWEKLIAMKRPGQVCAITLFRAGILRAIKLRLSKDPGGKLAIVPLKKVTPQQKRTFQNWLRTPWSRVWK